MSKRLLNLDTMTRKHIWHTTVSISKQLTDGYGISSDVKGVDQLCKEN